MERDQTPGPGVTASQARKVQMTETHENGGILSRDDQESVDRLLATFDTLVVTDYAGLGSWIDQEDRTRVCVVDDPDAPLTDADPLVVHAAKAGKTIRTWCLPTDGGRRVARETGKTLTPHMPAGEKVKHITAVHPDGWVTHPERADLKTLVDGARPTPPPSPRPSPNDVRTGGAPSADLASFDVTPLRLAERILERPEWASRCLLVTGELGEFVALYTRDPDTGIWRDPEATLLGWQAHIADELQAEVYGLAAQHRMDPKMTMSMVRAISSIKTPDKRSSVSRSFKAAVDRLRSRGISPNVRECTPADMNADMRYLGVRNGVVDLHTGTLVADETVAADAKITVSISVKYDPERYPAADWFLSHLAYREREWWLDTLGYALRGIPKRLYGCLAAPDSGKTSAINMLRKTLGPYVDSPTLGTLDARAKLDGSTHTPGLFAWFAPVRLTIIDELKERELSAALVKDLTGGGDVPARDTYGKRVIRRATGTTYIFANDTSGEQALPQLRTDDPGIKARYRELPFPAIPKERQNADVRDKWPLVPERQAQLLTLLVQRAAANAEEPADIPEVGAATGERLRKDSGELGEFASRMVRDGSTVLRFRHVWAEWCQHNSEPTEATAPGGIRKRDFVRRLSAHVEDLPKPTPMKVDGTNVRGWRGWKLLTVEEAEALRKQERSPNPRLDDERLRVTFYGVIEAQAWIELSLPRLKSETAAEYEQRREQLRATLGSGEKITGLDLFEKYLKSGSAYVTFFDDPAAKPSATAEDKRAAVLIQDNEMTKLAREGYESLCRAYEEAGAKSSGTVESLRKLSPTDWDGIRHRCLDVLRGLALLQEFSSSIHMMDMRPVDRCAPTALGETLPPSTVPVVPRSGLLTTMRPEFDANGNLMKIGRWTVSRSAAPDTESGIRLWSLMIDYAWRRCPDPRPSHPLELIDAKTST